ncbi:MAG: glycosyltransferase family 4 protein [Bacteroidetes bacterium]|nr:glycosyltransferase family 4 protein [Bacteroidota bacterium]
MKVLLLHQYIEIGGGADAHVHYMLEALPRYGVASRLMAIRSLAKGFEIELFGGAGAVHFSDETSAFDFIRELCEKEGIDIIHVHTITTPEITKQLSEHYPMVRTLHNAAITCLSGEKYHFSSGKVCDCSFGLVCLKNAYTEKCASVRKPGKLIGLFKRVSFEKANAAKMYSHLIAPSSFIRQNCIGEGIAGEMIEQIPYPYKKQVRPSALPQRPTVNIVYSGRLTKVKGVHLLGELMQPLMSADLNIVLHILGDGPLKDSLMKSQALSGPNVVFHGWLDQSGVQEIYEDADIVLIPSIYPDNFPIVCIEALCFGKPVIVFKVGGLPEMISDGINGFVIAPGDLKAMRERVLQLVVDKDKRRAMGAEGRRIYEEKFREEVVMPRYLAVYRESIEKFTLKHK